MTVLCSFTVLYLHFIESLIVLIIKAKNTKVLAHIYVIHHGYFSQSKHCHCFISVMLLVFLLSERLMFF